MKVSLKWAQAVSNVDLTKVGTEKLLEKIGSQLGAIDEITKVDGDLIIDIENKMFTHRPDCFGILGIAREVAGIQGLAFKSPDWYLSPPELKVDEATLPLTVQNNIPKFVSRFMAVVIDGITVGPSPDWMQDYLKRVGIKSINNVVDITNYVMYLTGQPLHAFDYHKIKKLSGQSPLLGVRFARENEPLTLLGNKRINLTPKDLVLTTDTLAVDLAGIMGSATSEVDAKTTAIILSCGTYDMNCLRSSSMRHGVFTEAATRYTKGQSPLQNEMVINYAVTELLRSTHGHVASQTYDVGFRRPATHTVKVGVDFINQRLGLKLTAAAMQRLLKNVEFLVRIEGDTLKVTPPFWRTDIHLLEDVVEEIGRLYGYDQLPLELPTRGLTPAALDPLHSFKNQVRQVLSRAGASEILSYSFVHGDLLRRVGQSPQLAFQIANALSPELQYYRLSLTPSLLDKVHPNSRAGFEQFALFEINKVHVKGVVDEEKLPAEFNRIALVVTDQPKTKTGTTQTAPYYQARTYLTYLLQAFGHEETVSFQPLSEASFGKQSVIEQLVQPYEPTRSAALLVGRDIVGVVGEYRLAVRQALKLPDYSAGFEIFHSFLMEVAPDRYTPMPKYPKVTQDISLRAPLAVTYDVLFHKLKQALAKLADNTVWQLQPLDIYQAPTDKNHRHLTWRLQIASYEQTLTDAKINQLLDKVAAEVKTKLGVTRL